MFYAPAVRRTADFRRASAVGRRGAIKAVVVCVALVVLSGCGAVSLDGGMVSLGDGAPLIRHAENDRGDVELVLDPVDVWDEVGLGAPFRIEDVHESLQFRLRRKELFERAWVRLGLFWNSRRDDVILTAAIYQPSIDIREATLLIDGRRFQMAPAQGFRFTPPKGVLDKDVSGAAFSMPPSFLHEMADGMENAVMLSTNRGTLKVNLAAVTDASPQALRRSANYLFAEFSRKQKLAATP